LGDLQNVKAAFDWARNVYVGYRIVSFAYDPISALVREMRELAGRGVTAASASEIKRWAVGYYVRKSGYYAIRLYGGELVLDDVAFDAFTTGGSQKDAQQADRETGRLAEEPLRIIVIGQVKAGKSSLINALFGNIRAATDVVCNTRRAQPYVLEREGIRQAIIYDTVGYDASSSQSDPFGQLRDLITRSDLVLLVCSATSAARGVDRRLLSGIRSHYQENPHRTMPPVVIPLTHVDQLRPFSEWAPPYDVARATGGKAAEIRRATQAVAEDLEVAAELVVPVCAKPEREYNIDEALMPAILAASPQAEQVKYQRCLREFRRKENWQQLWQQAINAGRVLVGARRRES
jgi:predicted GTPase